MTNEPEKLLGGLLGGLGKAAGGLQILRSIDTLLEIDDPLASKAGIEKRLPIVTDIVDEIAGMLPEGKAKDFAGRLVSVLDDPDAAEAVGDLVELLETLAKLKAIYQQLLPATSTAAPPANFPAARPVEPPTFGFDNKAA